MRAEELFRSSPEEIHKWAKENISSDKYNEVWRDCDVCNHQVPLNRFRRIFNLWGVSIVDPTTRLLKRIPVISLALGSFVLYYRGKIIYVAPFDGHVIVDFD